VKIARNAIFDYKKADVGHVTNSKGRQELADHKPVQLENAKTDERGKAVHEECYALKLESERALS
jgi:hypothetical protein